MQFTSFAFLIFFPLVTFLYYLAPYKFRWAVLLFASCIFYMYFIPAYIAILFVMIVVDYCAGIIIEKSKGKKRKIWLIVSIISNVGMLFFFKYFNFFQDNLSTLIRLIHWNYSPFLLHVILPLGLSFHTFQSLSYVIEVYKKKQKAEKHIGIYALYVMFYPQLVAGPIERPQQLLPQFYQKHAFVYENIVAGLRRMLLGFFKKLVIADKLAIIVNQVYGSPHNYIGLPLILATIAFAFQIYCDFSGYTDIALGAAKVMGFTLVENFNYPYLATSIPDFWRRWHISLYSWFRDYVYIPLGGNKVPQLRHMFNILIVFAITGLWHGANWNYVVWGTIHGVYMVIAVLIGNTMFQWEKYISSKLVLSVIYAVKVVVNFFLVCLAWVFFRALNLSDAIYIIAHSLKGIGHMAFSLLKGDMYSILSYLFNQGRGVGIAPSDFFILVGFLCMLGLIEYLQKLTFEKTPLYVRWPMYLFLLFSIINFSIGLVKRIPFIYFQF